MFGLPGASSLLKAMTKSTVSGSSRQPARAQLGGTNGAKNEDEAGESGESKLARIPFVPPSILRVDTAMFAISASSSLSVVSTELTVKASKPPSSASSALRRSANRKVTMADVAELPAKDTRQEFSPSFSSL